MKSNDLILLDSVSLLLLFCWFNVFSHFLHVNYTLIINYFVLKNNKMLFCNNLFYICTTSLSYSEYNKYLYIIL